MKDELGGKIMAKFVGLRPKTYSFLMDDGNKDKKAKATKKCVINRSRAYVQWLQKLFIKWKRSKDLKVNHILHAMKKSIRFHYIVIMIKDCKLLIELKNIDMDTSTWKVCKQDC